MIAICIESSHQRGMGHFYRALIMMKYFENAGEKSILILNEDPKSIKILDEKDISYETVDYGDDQSNWEQKLICKYHIDIWILDKFETSIRLAEHVKREGIILVAIDDKGAGADLADLHFCAMLFHDLRGRKIYTGKDYMILNPELARYKRNRTEMKKILVTLGGSDTYGATVKVVRILKNLGYGADIIMGPNFQHKDLLKREIREGFTIYDTVPSLPEKLFEYDLAVTGGGVTCFEANASGLPCIIVANELHEIDNAKYLASFGGAIFAGYYKDISEKNFPIVDLNIKEMSMAALDALSLNGMDNIYHVIREYREDI